MELKELEMTTLHEALSKMEVGETRIVPATVTTAYLKERCNFMSKSGAIYITSSRLGTPTVTRLK